MKVALWAEIRRLSEIEKLSGWAIARRLHCSRHTVAAALKLQQPPSSQTARRACVLDPYVDKIKDLLSKYPDLSAVRIREEIARGPQGYTGSADVLRRYLRKVRPARGRVYQEVHYEPAQAMQIDWGECGCVQVGRATRKVSVFVAVLCHSRLMYIEFTLSQQSPLLLETVDRPRAGLLVKPDVGDLIAPGGRQGQIVLEARQFFAAAGQGIVLHVAHAPFDDSFRFRITGGAGDRLHTEIPADGQELGMKASVAARAVEHGRLEVVEDQVARTAAEE